VQPEPILHREEAVAGVLLLADILAELKKIRRLLADEQEEEDLDE
jgi:hypothetical protein